MNLLSSQTDTSTSPSYFDTSNLTLTKNRLKKLSSIQANHEDCYMSQQEIDLNCSYNEKEGNIVHGTSKTSCQDDLDYQRGKRQQIARRNFMKALEDDEHLEKIAKKVKTFSDTETKTSSPLFIKKELDEETYRGYSQRSSKENKFPAWKKDNKSNPADNLIQHLEFNKKDSCDVNVNKEKKGFKIDIRQCKSLNVFQKESSNQIFFQVELIDEETLASKTIILTREQMMENNPKIALYFYENHLYFTEDPSFQPELMKRV